MRLQPSKRLTEKACESLRAGRSEERTVRARSSGLMRVSSRCSALSRFRRSASRRSASGSHSSMELT